MSVMGNPNILVLTLNVGLRQIDPVLRRGCTSFGWTLKTAATKWVVYDFDLASSDHFVADPAVAPIVERTPAPKLIQ
jgi:hypothetical protein